MDRHRTASKFCDRGAPNDHPIVIGRSRSIAILETRGVFWCVRSPSRGRLISIVTITIGRLAEGSTLDRGARDGCIVIVHLTGAIGRRRSFLEERRDRGAIEPRSHHDRIAIERRLHSFSGGIASRRPDDDRRSTKMKIMARSRRVETVLSGLFVRVHQGYLYNHIQKYDYLNNHIHISHICHI